MGGSEHAGRGWGKLRQVEVLTEGKLEAVRWPRACDAVLERLDDANFAPDGTAAPVCYRDQIA